MNLPVFAFKNVGRNKLRVGLTVLGVAVAMMAFILLRTILYGYTIGRDEARKDRLATRHSVSFIMQLPARYVEDMKNAPQLAGKLAAVTWFNWFGGKDPRNENLFFATFATDAKTFFDVYPEIILEPGVREAFNADINGAVIGDKLAKHLGATVGGTVKLSGTIYPGLWEFNVVGIYTAKDLSVDRSWFIFRWDRLNNSPQMPGVMKDQVGWIASRVKRAEDGPAVTAAIDDLFNVRDVQTLSMSERALQEGFMGMFSAVLKALDVVSIAILVIMLLIVGNTIAMGVRERTYEFGVLKALGFREGHVLTFILAEGLVVGLLGGLAGIGLAYPFIMFGIKKWLDESAFAFWFPYFEVPGWLMMLVIGVSMALGLVASSISAWRASQLNVVNALRRVE